MKRRKIVVIQNSALLVFGVLVSLGIGEVVCRATYTKPWYERLLDEQVRVDWRSGIVTNSFDLRDRDYPTVKPPNSRRVLILGDSFFRGAGVADTSLLFAERLETQLNIELAKEGKQVEILNGGIDGSITWQWVKLLEDVKDSFKPDVILIVFFLRDGSVITSQRSFFKPIRKMLEERDASSFLYEHVYLVRVFQERRDRSLLSEEYSQKLNDSYLGDSEQTKQWQKAKKNLLKIKDIGEQLDAEVALVVFPILVELNSNYPFQEVSDLIEQFSRESGFPTHNLLSAFMGMHGPDLWVSPLNQHPNPQGHEIAFQSMLPFLRELL